jgi:hypothetical protein
MKPEEYLMPSSVGRKIGKLLGYKYFMTMH